MMILEVQTISFEMEINWCLEKVEEGTASTDDKSTRQVRG